MALRVRYGDIRLALAESVWSRPESTVGYIVSDEFSNKVVLRFACRSSPSSMRDAGRIRTIFLSGLYFVVWGHACNL